MAQFQELFSIAGISFNIESNFEVAELLHEPYPYNLHINYKVDNTYNEQNAYSIVLTNQPSQPLSVATEKKVLKVNGDLSAMFTPGYNQQFSLFGNKGIINRYILHVLELNQIATLHASAITHPKTGQVVIGLGSSGSGKSVLTANGLKNGWKLISAEHVLIDTDLTIWSGNFYDNITPKAVSFIQEELPQAVIYKEKELIEPVGSKQLANLQAYHVGIDSMKMHNFSLVLMAFGDTRFAAGVPVNDEDFLLRNMQLVASEKICAPIIFADSIFDPSLMPGNTSVRSAIINALITQSKDKLLLGGMNDDISAWLHGKAEQQ